MPDRHSRPTSKILQIKEYKMTHEDAGNYAGKRQNNELNQSIAAMIREKISEKTISCAEAHNIATKLNVDPAEVGTTIDLLEIRLNKCQLGLFGHGKEKNIPELTDDVNPEIKSAILSALVNGRLACFAAWEISKKFKISKPMVSAACELMKIKIAPCQLGAFK